MSHEQVLDQRWEFRRKDSDLDSSSEDKGSSSARDQNLNKCNQLLNLVPADDEVQEVENSHNHEPNPPKREKSQPNSTQKTEEKKVKKKNNKGDPRTAKTKRVSMKNGYKFNLTTALHGLETHVNVLVKDLNTSREGFMKWMEDELEKLVPDNSSASPSKSAKGKSKISKKIGESGKKAPKANRSSKKITANCSAAVALEQKKAAVCDKEAQETEEVENVVSALADNKKGRVPGKLSTENSNREGRMPGMLSTENPNRDGRMPGMLSTENPSRDFVASNYLAMPNFNPRPLAENYLVKPSSSTMRIQPVDLDSHRNALNVQRQSDGYYQGGSLQSEREFSRPDVLSVPGYDRSFSASVSGSMGSLGGFPSTNNLGFKGGFNLHNLGSGGSESSAQENNFPSLRMMRFFGGSHGFQDNDMNNQLKYSN